MGAKAGEYKKMKHVGYLACNLFQLVEIISGH
jgi:hypothetical protein